MGIVCDVKEERPVPVDDCEMQFSVFESEGLVDLIGRGHWNGIVPGGNVSSELDESEVE